MRRRSPPRARSGPRRPRRARRPGRARPGRRRPVGGGSPLAGGRRGVRRRPLRDGVPRARALHPGRAHGPAPRRCGPPARQGGVLDGAVCRGARRVRRGRDLPPERRRHDCGRGDLLAGRGAVPAAPAGRGAGPLRALPRAQARLALRAGGPLRARPGRARDGARRRRDRHVPGLPPRLSEPPAGADGGVQRGARADPGQALGRRPRAPRARTRTAIRRAPISRRRAISWASPSSRPAVPKARGRSSSSSRSRRRATSCPRRACSRPRPRRRPGGPREALEQYQALVRAAPTHALVPQALYRIGELSLRLGRPADAEAAWTTLRRDFPQNAARRARRVSRPPGSTSSDRQWEPALQVAQSVADLKGEERSDALLDRRAERAAASPERGGRAGLPRRGRGGRRRPRSGTSKGWPGLAASLEAATDKEGAKRAYREIVDTQPGSGARALGQGPPRRARAPRRRRETPRARSPRRSPREPGGG